MYSLLRDPSVESYVGKRLDLIERNNADCPLMRTALTATRVHRGLLSPQELQNDHYEAWLSYLATATQCSDPIFLVGAEMYAEQFVKDVARDGPNP
jgi:hypothetical protein